MAQHHPSAPQSSRYPRPPRSLKPEKIDREEFDVPSGRRPQSSPLHLDADIPPAREATHRRVVSQSKLPADVGQSTARTVGYSMMAAGALIGVAGVGLQLLLQVSIAVPALLVAGGLLYLGRRSVRASSAKT